MTKRRPQDKRAIAEAIGRLPAYTNVWDAGPTGRKQHLQREACLRAVIVQAGAMTRGAIRLVIDLDHGLMAADPRTAISESQARDCARRLIIDHAEPRQEPLILIADAVA